MKAKTKIQKQIMSLVTKLPAITETQKNWAYKHCFDHIAYKLKKGLVTCMDCGHSWTDKQSKEHCACPHCGTKLKVEETRKHTLNQIEYFCIVTTCKEFQVLRFFYINAYQKKGKPTNYMCREAVQRWIRPDGKFETVALLRGMCFMYSDLWVWNSDLEIRPNRNVYNIMPAAIYPRQRTIPIIKRNGFKGEYHNIKPFDLFHNILTDSCAETLIKAGQFQLLEYFIYSHSSIENYWAAIKLCIRNKYNVSDATMWKDYINLLKYFHKDTNNPQNVCPHDLHAAHDLLMVKMNAIREREQDERIRQIELQRIEKNKKKQLSMQEREEEYAKMKSAFLDLNFSDGLIQVIVLRDLKDFEKEGECLNHCVYTNDYYLKPDSLVLSARIAEQRIETIEISLEKMDIVQCRGNRNQDTEYHNRIIELVKKNINQIRKRNEKKRKTIAA